MVTIKPSGITHWAMDFFLARQLKDRALWKKFVDVYRTQPDADNFGWRGEFWGKMLRGAALVCGYSGDDELYEILTETVRDMMTAAEPDGRVSTYPRDREFDAWDLWCRKYVLLACEYYLEICRDEAFNAQVLDFLSACADYIIAHIGSGQGQKDILDASRSWLGLNSSSILEPMVRLYRLTGREKYLSFATYIVKQGGAKGINIFRLAYENKLYPYQYGVSKAYEMMSCFEGLLEYYYATGIEDCKTAVVNFANAVMATELSVIGCSGITHELFDYTAARQTVRQEDVLQETCVTVTWMKFCGKLLALTGDSRFADCMEQSFYNAYLGAFNTEYRYSPHIRQKFVTELGLPDVVDTHLPLDSYSPLLSGKRGVKVGGDQLLPDGSYYGCCACISSAGVGVFAEHMVTGDSRGITVNFFESGSFTLQYEDVTVALRQETQYPTDGRVTLSVRCSAPKAFPLRLRIPGWTGKSGYAVYEREWYRDVLTVEYPMPLRTQRPMTWDTEVVYTDMRNLQPGYHVAAPVTVRHDPDDDRYIALLRGPLTLAADSRTGKPAGSVFDFEPQGELTEDREIVPGVPCLLKLRFTDRAGTPFYLVDYASAGRDWETEIAAWLRTQ